MLERLLERGPHARLDRIERLDLLRHGEPHPGERVALGQLHGLGQLRRRRVERVATGDDRVEERDVAHRLRDRPDLVEARGERDDAVARDRPVRRPQADVPAQRRWLLDRAARVGAEPPRREPRRHRRGRAAARAARNARRIPRVPRRPPRRVLRRRAHRELVGVRLAEQREPRAPSRARRPSRRRRACTR